MSNDPRRHLFERIAPSCLICVALLPVGCGRPAPATPVVETPSQPAVPPAPAKSSDVQDDRLLAFDICVAVGGVRELFDPEPIATRIRTDPATRDRVELVTPVLESVGRLKLPPYHPGGMWFVNVIGIPTEPAEAPAAWVAQLGHPPGFAGKFFELSPAAVQRYLTSVEMNARLSEPFPLPQPAVMGFRDQPGLPPPAVPETPPPPPRPVYIAHGMASYREYRDGVPGEEKSFAPAGTPLQLKLERSFETQDVIVPVTVCGTFRSPSGLPLGNCVLMPLGEMQRFVGAGGRVNALFLKLKNAADSAAVVAALRESRPDAPRLDVQSWAEVLKAGGR